MKRWKEKKESGKETRLLKRFGDAARVSGRAELSRRIAAKRVNERERERGRGRRRRRRRRRKGE
jgi:hypothetical protein